MEIRFWTIANQLFRMEIQLENVGKGFEQTVLNQVTEAIHIIHFAKNLGDKLVDVHSVGQNNICAEKKRGAMKTTNADTWKKSSKGNINNILQQLIGLAPQQQLLVLGMKMEIIQSSILQVCSFYLKKKI